MHLDTADKEKNNLWDTKPMPAIPAIYSSNYLTMYKL
jgi:hypothetical protein